MIHNYRIHIENEVNEKIRKENTVFHKRIKDKCILHSQITFMFHVFDISAWRWWKWVDSRHFLFQVHLFASSNNIQHHIWTHSTLSDHFAHFAIDWFRLALSWWFHVFSSAECLTCSEAKNKNKTKLLKIIIRFVHQLEWSALSMSHTRTSHVIQQANDKLHYRKFLFFVFFLFFNQIQYNRIVCRVNRVVVTEQG